MAEKHVVFLEEPRVGQRVKILYDGQTGLSFPVTAIRRHPRDSDILCVTTAGGAALAGRVAPGITKSPVPVPASAPVPAARTLPPPGPFDHVAHVQFVRERLGDFASRPWTVTVEFGRSSSSAFGHILACAKSHASYEEILNSEGDPIHAVTFGPQDMPAFEEIYRLVKGWKTTSVRVCGSTIALSDVNKWLRCYRDKLVCQQSNPLFCYGASPFTFNIFGCHRTMIREDWYEYGQMQPNGTFVIDKRFIAAKIVENLLPYRICPALDPELMRLGFSMIPDAVNPRRDPEWTYVMLADGVTAIGVQPRMTEIVMSEHMSSLSTPDGDISLTSGMYMQVLVTPQFVRLYTDLLAVVRIRGPYRPVFRVSR